MKLFRSMSICLKAKKIRRPRLDSISFKQLSHQSCLAVEYEFSEN